MTTNRRKIQSGFTVVELMVAIVAMSIFALIVGSLLFYAWTAWHRNTDSVQMQRDATLAMRTIEKEIRRTPVENFILVPGSSLTCVNTNGVFYFTQSGGNLNMQVDSGTLFPLVRDFVTSFDTSTNASGWVRVVLNLDTGYDSSSITNIIYSRN